MPAASIRARVRAEMTAEIKASRAAPPGDRRREPVAARGRPRHGHGVVGASTATSPAGTSCSTALIVDAYNALGEAVEAADAAVSDRSQLRARWLASRARAVRGWALASPAEYALLYGSPVPGYAAPPDTIAAAARTPVVLVRILADGFASGALRERPHRRSAAARRAGRPPASGPQRPASPRAWPTRPRGPDPGPRRHRPELPEELMLAGITAGCSCSASSASSCSASSTT